MAIWAAPSGTSNFSGSTWQSIDSTSYLWSEAAQVGSTTSFVASSSTFTPGAITIDGIGLRISYVSSTPSGTFSVDLSVAGVEVTGTLVTCNITDLPPASSVIQHGGWYFFKFASPVTLASSTAYAVRIKSSVTSQVVVYASTSTNFSRYLRTTTTGTPAAADTLAIVGDVMGAGSTSSTTVDHDYTTNTQYAQMDVGAYGKWILNTAASTNYYYQTNGNIYVTPGATMNWWQAGVTSIPSTSTSTIFFNSSGAGTIGLVQRQATYYHAGTPKTRYSFLAANVSAGATSFTTTTSTGWLSGDQVVLADTTINGNQGDSVTLSGNASGTSVSTSSITHAHSGSGNYVGEVINLTSNSQIIGASSANTGVVDMSAGTWQVDNVSFNFMGGGNNNPAFYILYNCNGSSITNCAFQESSNYYMIQSSNTADNFTISGCVFWGVNVSGASHIYISSTSGTVGMALNNNISLGAYNANSAISVQSHLCSVNGLWISGGVVGFNITDDAIRTLQIQNVTIHSTVASAINPFNVGNGNIIYNGCNFWNNAGNAAIMWGGLNGGYAFNYVINNCNFYSNTGGGVYLYGGEATNIYFTNCTFNAGTGPSLQPIGFGTAANQRGGCSSVYFDNCSFGASQAHATGDFNGSSTQSGTTMKIICRDTTLSSPTTFANATNCTPNSYVAIQRLNGTAGSHKTIFPTGVSSTDTTIYDSTPVSQRLTPSSATLNIRSGYMKIPVANGKVAIFKIRIRKSNTSSGDSATYNGTQPTVILMANPSAGSAYNTDIVAITADNNANGQFWSYQYTLPTNVTDDVGMQFYVQCNGTAGWINIDTVRIS